ncbi:MAG: multiheme c-type cytochrome, partial [Deltaproteobacteria bacterium]|nr:multiheme c-type cytochrome [Deltaproteobacteria bacterium]
MVFLLSLVSVSSGDWSEFLQKEYPKTPWEKRPRVEQNVCIDCHTSDLMKEDYREIPAAWRKSWHDHTGVSCQDCHGGDPKDAARSLKPESGFVGVP